MTKITCTTKRAVSGCSTPQPECLKKQKKEKKKPN